MAFALGSLIAGLLGKEVLAKGLLRKGIAARFIWPALRTVGFLSQEIENRLPSFLERPLALLRLAPLPFFGVGSFRRGVAYTNTLELAEGWLSFFPEMLVTGTTAHRLAFGLEEALGRGDFIAVLDVLGDTAAEAGLEDLVAVLRGIAQIMKDAETVVGKPGAGTIMTDILGGILGDLSTGEIVDVGDIIRELEDLTRGKDRGGETADAYKDRLEAEAAEALLKIFGLPPKARIAVGRGQEIIQALKGATGPFEKILAIAARALG